MVVVVADVIVDGDHVDDDVVGFWAFVVSELVVRGSKVETNCRDVVVVVVVVFVLVLVIIIILVVLGADEAIFEEVIVVEVSVVVLEDCELNILDNVDVEVSSLVDNGVVVNEGVDIVVDEAAAVDIDEVVDIFEFVFAFVNAVSELFIIVENLTLEVVVNLVVKALVNCGISVVNEVVVNLLKYAAGVVAVDTVVVKNRASDDVLFVVELLSTTGVVMTNVVDPCFVVVDVVETFVLWVVVPVEVDVVDIVVVSDVLMLVVRGVVVWLEVIGGVQCTRRKT